jgi:hypothetical protein
MYGGYLRLLPPLKLVAMILLKVALNTKNEIKLLDQLEPNLVGIFIGWSSINLCFFLIEHFEFLKFFLKFRNFMKFWKIFQFFNLEMFWVYDIGYTI